MFSSVQAMKALDALAARYPQKRVLITGATSGMGEALALQFAAAGFRVAVASRNPAKVAATCEQRFFHMVNFDAFTNVAKAHAKRTFSQTVARKINLVAQTTGFKGFAELTHNFRADHFCADASNTPAGKVKLFQCVLLLPGAS